MEIHIKKGDHLTIYVTNENGEVKTFPLTYIEMLSRGMELTDGLTRDEIYYLHEKKKISAIRLYRGRTGLNLKESKEAVEAWVERNQCCTKWPYCEHVACIRELDITRLHILDRGLSTLWYFSAEITEEQAHALMSIKGRGVQEHGFYSFRVEDGKTSWASNLK